MNWLRRLLARLIDTHICLTCGTAYTVGGCLSIEIHPDEFATFQTGLCLTCQAMLRIAYQHHMTVAAQRTHQRAERQKAERTAQHATALSAS